MSTPARLYAGPAPAPGETVYTATSLTRVLEILAVNLDREPRGAGQTVEVDIDLVTTDAVVRIASDVIEAGGQLVWSLGTVVESGDSLRVRASAAGRADVTISGEEDADV